jgi:hypothetical protein
MLSAPPLDCPTEAEVRLEVKKDEDSAIAGGTSPLMGRSATAFLIAGLQIEEAQCVHRIIIYVNLVLTTDVGDG